MARAALSRQTIDGPCEVDLIDKFCVVHILFVV